MLGLGFFAYWFGRGFLSNTITKGNNLCRAAKIQNPTLGHPWEITPSSQEAAKSPNLLSLLYPPRKQTPIFH